MLCGKLAQYGEPSKMRRSQHPFLKALVPYGSFRSVAIYQSMPPAQHGQAMATAKQQARAHIMQCVVLGPGRRLVC
jgi:hypothetical protein